VAELAEAIGDPGWVAEDPEAHLLPHVMAACSEADAPLRIASYRSEGEIFVVELEARDDTGSICRRKKDGVIEFDVVTGSASEARFTPHGHLVRLRIHASPLDPPSL
jgi:hypothetical protein